MDTARTLVRSAREGARLSQRELARLAGVPPTTVNRVESGQTDATFGMLVRLLDAAGHEMKISTRPRGSSARGPRLADLATAWSEQRTGSPDWTRLRAFLDYLTLHPEGAGPAISARPPSSPSPILDTMLAGIAEKIADDAGLPRPAWTRRVPRLESDWSEDGTPRMIKRWREATPPQLLARGLIVDGDSLWRDRRLSAA
jgi:transcriptional regulator with XRE-family HTH domain